MATITWPETLPEPLQDGFGETPPDTSLRSSMDSGPDKIRRRYTAGPRPFSLKYHLTKVLVATLDDFFVTASRSGSLAFNWMNPRTGSACEARFLSAPKYGAAENESDVSVQIEVLP